jgi:hypothetical protein
VSAIVLRSGLNANMVYRLLSEDGRSSDPDICHRAALISMPNTS